MALIRFSYIFLFFEIGIVRAFLHFEQRWPTSWCDRADKPSQLSLSHPSQAMFVFLSRRRLLCVAQYMDPNHYIVIKARFIDKDKWLSS